MCRVLGRTGLARGAGVRYSSLFFPQGKRRKEGKPYERTSEHAFTGGEVVFSKGSVSDSQLFRRSCTTVS